MPGPKPSTTGATHLVMGRQITRAADLPKKRNARLERSDRQQGEAIPLE